MKVEPGDFVMVRIKAFGRDHKIADNGKLFHPGSSIRMDENQFSWSRV